MAQTMAPGLLWAKTIAPGPLCQPMGHRQQRPGEGEGHFRDSRRWRAGGGVGEHTEEWQTVRRKHARDRDPKRDGQGDRVWIWTGVEPGRGRA